MRLILAILFCLIAVGAVGNASERPNIVFIFADDMGIGDVGVYNQLARAERGMPAIETPHIDSLAAAGVRFMDMHSNPMCGPSRATIQHGFHSGHSRIDRNQPRKTPIQPGDHEKTFAQILSEAGYYTGLIGRWHLRGLDIVTGNIYDVNSTPWGKGYQEVYLMSGYRPEYAYRNHQDDDGNPLEVREAEDIVRFTPDRATDPSDEWAIANGGLGVAPRYSTEMLTEQAVAFLRKRIAADDEPFMLFLPIFNVHSDTNEVPNQGIYAGLSYPDRAANYASSVAYVDYMVGRILETLRDPNGDGSNSDGVLDNTIVIFTSDNGPQAASHDIGFFESATVYDSGLRTSVIDSRTNRFQKLRGKKMELYEGGTRMPFIIQWPDNSHIVPGSRYDEMCTFADWLPTVADLVEGEIPLGIDGVSFWPDLSGQGPSRRADFRLTMSNTLHWRGWTITVGDWKLVHRKQSGEDELYNLALNPGEEYDQRVTDRPDIVEALRTVALDEGVESDADLSSNLGGTWFSQYKEWAPVNGSDDFYAAANWSGGIPNTAYDGSGQPADNWNTAPARNWIATVRKSNGSGNELAIDKDVKLLALEILGDQGPMTVKILPRQTLTVRNGLHIESGGSLHGDHSELNTIRAIEVKPGGSLTGHLRITGQQDLLRYIPEFADDRRLSPELVNHGTVAPGSLFVDGDYRQFTDGILEIDLDDNESGRDNGVNDDTMEVAGTATLDGTLKVNLLNGHTPEAGDRITIIRANAIEGKFTLPGDIVTSVDGRARFVVEYSRSAVVLRYLED